MMRKNSQSSKKSWFFEEIACNTFTMRYNKMDMGSKLTKKEYKRILSGKETKIKIEVMREVIKDKTIREQSISFLKALDGKRIRNTSGT